ncbi:MAG: GntR family transcriptional regulator [Streptosporangiaceae bacterium]
MLLDLWWGLWRDRPQPRLRIRVALSVVFAENATRIVVQRARLPGERDLAKEYGVALGTARRAVKELVERGLVRVLPGRGTFVTRLLRGADQLKRRNGRLVAPARWGLWSFWRSDSKPSSGFGQRFRRYSLKALPESSWSAHAQPGSSRCGLLGPVRVRINSHPRE